MDKSETQVKQKWDTRGTKKVAQKKVDKKGVTKRWGNCGKERGQKKGGRRWKNRVEEG